MGRRSDLAVRHVRPGITRLYIGQPAIHGPISRAPRAKETTYTRARCIALDLDTGKMKWHFQFTPHDTHDWDAQSWPVLIDMEWNGKMRKVVLHANRNGFFYVLDRTTRASFSKRHN